MTEDRREHILDANFPIRRMPIAALLQRIWELRDNLTAYDAAYVTLAERIDGPLLTCDAKLTGASGPRCTFELITTPFKSADPAATARAATSTNQASIPDHPTRVDCPVRPRR